MTRILLLLTVLLSLATEACAQQGLNVDHVYEGNVVKKSCMVENIIKGKQLACYKLHFFRSIKFKATEKQRAEIERCVDADMRYAQDLEMERGTRLNYAMMTLKPMGEKAPKEGELWYLCYQCVPVKGVYAITLVFMQGHATLNEMRVNFKKQ